MRNLKLYNSATDKIEPFSSRSRGRVKLFTCGPSVYRRQHIGNYRTYLFEDVLHKYLEYQGYTVERVINFTDVEDKAIAEAAEKGIAVEALRRPVEEEFFKICEVLAIHLPQNIPRATTSVEAAVDLIKRLIDRGHAYWHRGQVYYDPLSYDGFGRLFGLDMSRWPDKKIRFHRDTYPGQRWNLGDFILWHKRGKKDGDVWWDTEIGQGRPAWNIQDAAMISKHLGFEIDIHTGGIDNLYRHHDYTLAIMEGASGKKFCPYWLHGGHLLVEGRKMSKSKENVIYVDDLLDLGFLPRHIRWFLLDSPYRQSRDLSIGRLETCAGRLDRVGRLVDMIFHKDTKPEKGGSGNRGAALIAQMRTHFEEHMNDNLDVVGAFDAVAEDLLALARVSGEKGLSKDDRASLKSVLDAMDKVLGVLGRTSS